MSAKKEWPLYFSEQLGSDTYGLFEVDESLLDEILKTGTGQIKQGAIVSEGNKGACLSSETRTYKLKVSETSNSLMVADLA